MKPEVVSISGNLINFSMLNDIYDSGTLKRKLYQLIISRLEGGKIRNRAYRKHIMGLVGKGIGGFIVFGGRKDRLREFIDEIQSSAETSLFIASDIERGVEQQIRGATAFPCQMAVAAAIDIMNPEGISILEHGIGIVADEAADAGINMPLIPVMDVNRNPDNPIICTRAFSDNPDEVARFGSKYIEILESKGLISCAKHFPGHGDTSVDSHISLPIIRKPEKDLMDTDVAPFAEAVKAGVSSVMIGHLAVPAFDSVPASLSYKIITGLLRERLGFKGLVLTDALNMYALRNIENAPAGCIKAGADILLHPDDADLTVRELENELASGGLSPERIDASLKRILKAKERLPDMKQTEVNYKKNKALSSWIAGMSITLLKKTAEILPLKDKNGTRLIFAGDSKYFEKSPLKRRFKKFSGTAGALKAEIGTAIFALFTGVAAWKGSSGIEEDEKARISDIIKKSGKSVVISFGSPYVLRHFKEADILIAAYEATSPAQKAVIKCLNGEMEFRGRLPVNMDIRE